METRLSELRKTPRPGLPKGYTLEQVADGITDRGLKRATASQISKLERGDLPLNDDWLKALADFYEVRVGELFPTEQAFSAKTVSLVGYVGAGEMYYPDPTSGPWVGFDEVEAPPGADGVCAVRVRGDSMSPVYRDGDLVYFHRDGLDLERCVGKDCIVQVRNGPAYIKRLERNQRTGRLRLVSYGNLDPIENPDVEWAAPVKWVMRG